MNQRASSALSQMKAGGQSEIWEGAQAIVKNQNQELATQLLALVRDSPDVERRVAAAWALGSLRIRLALELLILILDNPSEPPALREQAAESLGYLSDPTARDVLIRNLKDENVDVIFSCAFALRTVGRPDDIPHLDRLTYDRSLTNSYGALVAQEAREAIEQIKIRAQVPD